MSQNHDIAALCRESGASRELAAAAERAAAGARLTSPEAVILFEQAPLPMLQSLADRARAARHGDAVFFNRNFHIEPTNLCVYDCKFCSYSRALKQADAGWTLSADEILDIVRSYDGAPVTEVHIVGGAHPKMGLHFFGEVISRIKAHRPDLHVKAFTAVELHYMIRKAKMSYREGLAYLKSCGLDSLPGGGAEIFAAAVRQQICADKCSGEEWLEIHGTAHELGIPSNATMLFGHIESFADRVDHMERLRSLQDRTHGFNTFIPLKFRNAGNQMWQVPESSHDQDMRTYAVARLFLDNIAHLKAYWPMLGRVNAQRALAYGVDDIDGTIDDSTKIYSMAGAEEQRPAMSTEQLVALIHGAGRRAVERDTLYRVIQDFPRESAPQEATA